MITLLKERTCPKNHFKKNIEDINFFEIKLSKLKKCQECEN